MHVMVANNIYPPIMAGGAELIVAYLCESLAARGHRVTVVSTCAPDMEPYPDEVRNGVEIIRFFPPNLYWSFTRERNAGVKKAIWHARDAWNREVGQRFAAILDRSVPDVLHTHLIDGMSASIWGQARQAGVRVIHTAHDYHLLCPRAFLLTRDWKICASPKMACRIYRHWHLRTTRYLDCFASPSRFLLDRHLAAGLGVERSMVVHNGVPQPDTVARVRGNRKPDSRLRFLMISRLTAEKGVEVVLDAVARLPNDLPIVVEIAGKGPLESTVRKAADRDPRIRYLGYIEGEAKLDALARAGSLLLPSLWYENAPVVIAEAAAYGLAVIGSHIGGIPEFVREGTTGLLVPPGDSEALADAMKRFATDPNLLPGLSERSSELARQFTVERMTDAYEELYERVLERPRQAFAAA